MNTINLQTYRRLLAVALLLVVALGLTDSPTLGLSPAAAGEDPEMLAVLEAVGQGTPVERLRRLTGGRAGWPTEAQAAEEFKVLRSSEQFAPARDLPHAESGKEVDRVRRVIAPLVELHGGGSTLVISVLRTPRPIQGIGRGSVYLISSGLLASLNDDELLALSAHEFGHQYFRREFARAEDAGDMSALRIIEFKCDAIAVLSLLVLNKQPGALVSGLEWAKGPAYDIGAGVTSTHPDLSARKRLIARLAT